MTMVSTWWSSGVLASLKWTLVGANVGPMSANPSHLELFCPAKSSPNCLYDNRKVLQSSQWLVARKRRVSTSTMRLDTFLSLLTFD
jgi:hypothetical protein